MNRCDIRLEEPPRAWDGLPVFVFRTTLAATTSHYGCSRHAQAPHGSRTHGGYVPVLYVQSSRFARSAFVIGTVGGTLGSAAGYSLCYGCTRELPVNAPTASLTCWASSVSVRTRENFKPVMTSIERQKFARHRHVCQQMLLDRLEFANVKRIAIPALAQFTQTV